MKLIINGEEAKIPSGSSSGGVTMDQVNSAIDTKLDTYEPQEVYSTEETRIGTWIDGKPLYRRVLTKNITGVTNINHTVYSSSEVETYTFLRGWIKGGVYSAPTGYTNGVDEFLVLYQYLKNAQLYGKLPSVYENGIFTGILEYTKTTDQARTAAANTVLKASLKAPALNAIQSAAVTASAQEVLTDV